MDETLVSRMESPKFDTRRRFTGKKTEIIHRINNVALKISKAEWFLLLLLLKGPRTSLRSLA